jgi:hypothetical protein
MRQRTTYKGDLKEREEMEYSKPLPKAFYTLFGTAFLTCAKCGAHDGLAWVNGVELCFQCGKEQKRIKKPSTNRKIKRDEEMENIGGAPRESYQGTGRPT